MKVEAENIILYDSPEAASIKTVTGWVDRHGHFWGNDEDMARYCGSTHRRCPKCGGIYCKINKITSRIRIPLV